MVSAYMKEKAQNSNIERNLFANWKDKQVNGFDLESWASDLRAAPNSNLIIESLPVFKDKKVSHKLYNVLSKVPIIEAENKDTVFYPECSEFMGLYLYEFTSITKIVRLKSKDREFFPR